MAAFGFTNSCYVQTKGRKEKEFIVVKTSLTKKLWQAWWLKPGYYTSIDTLLQIFKQATVDYGWIFSLDEHNSIAPPRNNILVLTSLKLFQQLETSRISIVEGTASDIDSENNSSGEESECSPSDSNDDGTKNNTVNTNASNSRSTENDIGGSNINSNTLHEEVTPTENISTKSQRSNFSETKEPKP